VGHPGDGSALRPLRVLSWGIGAGAVFQGLFTLLTRGPFAEAYFTYPDALIAGGVALILYDRKFLDRGMPMLLMAVGARALLERAQENPLGMFTTPGLWSPALVLLLQFGAVLLGWHLAGRPVFEMNRWLYLAGLAFVIFSASRLYPVFGDLVYVYVYFGAMSSGSTGNTGA
jgi:hypothetical protein